MSSGGKSHFRREILILVLCLGLLLVGTLGPGRKWLIWSSEQRAVESYIRASLSAKEEWEILAWQPAVAVHKQPGADRAIWCSYKTTLPRDKPRYTKGIFLFQDGRVQKVMDSGEAKYVETYRQLWGEPRLMGDILVGDTNRRTPTEGTPTEAQPNWDEPSTPTRLRLCRRLITHWQRKLNRAELPPSETLREYLKALPLDELVALGHEGNCFLDRNILKQEWEERGKKDPWFHPTFLHREDVLVSAEDKQPFVICKEMVTDSSGSSHLSSMRESQGVLQKQRGGLPPKRLVWIASDVSEQQVTLPGDPSAWNCVEYDPLRPAPPAATASGAVPPAPEAAGPSPVAQTPPEKEQEPVRVLEFTARRVNGGLMRVRGKVINQSDAPLENLWVRIRTPGGPVSAPVAPKQLPAGEVGTFTRDVRRYTNADQYKVEVLVGKPK